MKCQLPKRDPGFPQVIKVAGVPRLFVNGRAMAGITYHSRQNEFYEYMRQFADSGTEIFFMYYVRDWNEGWDTHFRKAAKRMDNILSFNNRVYVILGIYLSVNEAWAAANPNELCFRDGKPYTELLPVADTQRWGDSGCYTAPYSLASEKFDLAAEEHINRSLDFLESYHNSDRVIGIFLGGGKTHEWNPFAGSGPAGLKAYRDYLRAKYGTENNLRQSWDDEDASFDNVVTPANADFKTASRGYYYHPGGKGQRIIDWRWAQEEARKQRILNAAKAVKRRRPDLLTGFFYAHRGNTGGRTHSFLESKDIDFLVSPSQYSAACLGQHNPPNQIVDSFHLYGKLFFSEEDLWPHDAVCCAEERATRLPPCGDAKDLADSLSLYEKALGQAIAKGTMAWYYHFQREWFEREKKYFDMNRRMLDISRLAISENCCSNAEILVVVDESAAFYRREPTRKPWMLAHGQGIQGELTYELGYIGAPYDVMFADSLSHPEADFSRYKLVLLLNNHMVTRKQRELLDSLKSGGRTIVFKQDSGFLSEESADIENMKDLTGFEFEQMDIEWAATVTLIDTPNPVNRYLPRGYMFGQGYRGMRMLGDGKGEPFFPPPIRSSPVFAVSDREAMDLGFYNLEMDADFKVQDRTGMAFPYRLTGFNLPSRYFVGMALKEHKEWRALYAGVPLIPAALLRAICKYAGVHLYLETDDVIYCNNRFLVLHTNERSGIRELRFPKRTTVCDLKEGKIIGADVDTVALDCPGRRTWLLWYAPSGDLSLSRASALSGLTSR